MSLSTINQGLLNEKLSISLDAFEETSDKANALVVQAINADISQLGFMLDGAAIDGLSCLSENDLSIIHSDLVNHLKIMVGAHVSYHPLFVNFPDDIPDDSEYLFKRIWGAIETILDIKSDDFEVLSCGHTINSHLFDLKKFGACPICQMQVPELLDNKAKKPTLSDITPFKLISLSNDKAYYELLVNLCQSNTPLSEKHRELIISEIHAHGHKLFEKVNFNQVSQKEILILIIGETLKTSPTKMSITYQFELKDYFKTMTDVLRLAAYLSGGDYTLKEFSRFKLKSAHRKIIMMLADNVVLKNFESLNEQNTNDDLLRHKEKWIRLAHHLHVGSKANQFPFLFSIIQKLREKRLSPSVNGQIEMLVEKLAVNTDKDHPLAALASSKEKTVKELLPIISRKPGVFGRYLDVIVRNSGNLQNEVILSFEKVSQQITTPNLLKMIKHFETRQETQEYRAFIPKGNVAKIKFVDDERPLVSHDTAERIISVCKNALNERFSNMETMGHVYISKELKNHLLPFSQRSASNQSFTLTRGSRVSFDKNAEAVRFFLYWKETLTSDRVDVDLSTVCFDDNWNSLGHISYTRLSDGASYHSGDIQSAPHGASEFIDVNVQKYLEKGVRYVLMSVFSYTRQNFDEFEAFAGFMERQNVNTGEAYEPKTVKNKFSVDGKSTQNVPMIIDLKERKIIWADLGLSGRQINNVENNSEGLTAIARMIEESKNNTFSVFDLLEMHAQNRAESIDYEYDSEKEYDYIFGDDYGAQLDEISSDWLI